MRLFNGWCSRTPGMLTFQLGEVAVPRPPPPQRLLHLKKLRLREIQKAAKFIPGERREAGCVLRSVSVQPPYPCLARGSHQV